MESPTKDDAATTDTDPLPRLVHIGEIEFHLGEVTIGRETPRGTFLFCPITGGHFTTVFPLPSGFGIHHSTATAGLRAEILPGGGDYPLIHDGERAELNVSVVAKSLINNNNNNSNSNGDNNERDIFRITSFGVCEWNDLVVDMMGQAAGARSTQLGEVNAWQVFRFNTDSREYAWLNWACVIGQERLLYEDGRMAKTQMKLFQFLVR
ncbi:hypothetical protein LZ554_009407 [Drepanopeziza brunnea f. sp. 'monogermtubi']|nr:hypothetical protein LZ554_009407 [Drepanopeziza brunnea f. sp. 'monogermtubi']